MTHPRHSSRHTPSRTLLLTTLATAGAACVPQGGDGEPPREQLAVAPRAIATGAFHVSGGQIIAPDGSTFVARGVNLFEDQMSSVSTGSSGQPLTSLFSGINFVRVNCFGFNAPAFYQTFIAQMSALHIVVELEDHTNNAGNNAGGSTGTVFTGQELADESSWYAALASAYAGNPYVWFGTDNEPSENPSAAALSAWQQQTYHAIRDTGNPNPILVEMNGGNTPGSFGAGYTRSVYTAMTNIVWDVHYYGWLTNFSTDAQVLAQTLAQDAAASQGFTSADGLVPIIIGEYGNSTTGGALDPNGTQVVAAVQASGFGTVAWGYDPDAQGDQLVTDGGALTDYGQQVASYIASHGADGAGAIVNAGNGLCLDIREGSTASGAAVQQFTCNDTGAQRFVVSGSTGAYQIRNANSGLCVDVPGSSTAAGTALQQFACNGTGAQTFDLVLGDNATYALKNANSGLCIAAPGASSAAGVALQQLACGGANQQFQIAGFAGAGLASGTTVHLRSSNGDFASAINGGGAGVTVDRTVAQGWESFTIRDLGQPALRDGDPVTLQAASASFLSAECGGGTAPGCGVVNANRSAAQGWETFTIRKLGGSAGPAIASGDSISLTSFGGFVCSAEQGGGAGSILDCNRASAQAWETFTISR